MSEPTLSNYARYIRLGVPGDPWPDLEDGKGNCCIPDGVMIAWSWSALEPPAVRIAVEGLRRNRHSRRPGKRLVIIHLTGEDDLPDWLREVVETNTPEEWHQIVRRWRG